MNENTKKLFALLESDQSLAEKIHKQETIDAAYAIAEEAVPGLTLDEFREWARIADTDKEGALTNEQLEGATGGGWNPKNWIVPKKKPVIPRL